MSDAVTPWLIRWKGVESSFADWQEVQDALDRGDLSLYHEIQYAGRWWTLRDFLEKEPWQAPVSPAPTQSPVYFAHANDLPPTHRREAPPPVAPLTASTPSESPGEESHLVLATGVSLLALALLALVSNPWLILPLALVGCGGGFFLVWKGFAHWSWVGLGLLVLFAVTVLTKLIFL